MRGYLRRGEARTRPRVSVSGDRLRDYPEQATCEGGGVVASLRLNRLDDDTSPADQGEAPPRPRERFGNGRNLQTERKYAGICSRAG
jgi:hypothetical protein